MAAGPVPILSVTGVGKVFQGSATALHNINLQISRGEFVSLLGPSGCGKSTLLRIVAGLMTPTEGQITWDETLEKGAIGVVFQDPTLMPWLNVCRNVETPLRIAALSGPERRIRAVDSLARVGLQDFTEAYPRTLSGGMKMRVSIARALITHPSVLLLDEPFAALDEFTRQQLNDDLLQICAATGLTVVFVTHSIAEAVYLSDRILMMSGRPGTIIHEKKITPGYPRSEAFRHSPLFANLCGEISAGMRDNVTRQAAS